MLKKVTGNNLIVVWTSYLTMEQTSDNIDDSSPDDFDIKIPDKNANDDKESEQEEQKALKVLLKLQ